MVSYEQTHKQCRRCGRPTVHYRKATNHILHFLITVVTCGWWIFVWLLLAFKIGGWRCQECGAGSRLSKVLGGALALVGLTVTGLIAIGIMTGPTSDRSAPSAISTPKPAAELVEVKEPSRSPAESQHVDRVPPDPAPAEPPAVPGTPPAAIEAAEPAPPPERAARAAESPVKPPMKPAPAIEAAGPLPANRPSASLRTWTDATGQFTIEAEFAGYSVGQVKLKKADGSILTLPIEKLSEPDQKWIRDRRR